MAENQAEAKRPEIDGIGEEEWNSWRRHPTTRLFRKYLKAYAKMHTEDAINTIVAEPMSLEQQAHFRMRVRLAHEFEALRFDEVLTVCAPQTEDRPTNEED